MFNTRLEISLTNKIERLWDEKNQEYVEFKKEINDLKTQVDYLAE